MWKYLVESAPTSCFTNAGDERGEPDKYLGHTRNNFPLRWNDAIDVLFVWLFGTRHFGGMLYTRHLPSGNKCPVGVQQL
jgi:hypothetical protein